MTYNLQNLEAELIQKALRKVDSIDKAAKLLNIPEDKLRRKMRKQGIIVIDKNVNRIK